jgi:hypothetical protein
MMSRILFFRTNTYTYTHMRTQIYAHKCIHTNMDENYQQKAKQNRHLLDKRLELTKTRHKRHESDTGHMLSYVILMGPQDHMYGSMHTRACTQAKDQHARFACGELLRNKNAHT